MLALVGRVEARDFIDTLACDERVQPLGYLAWAASGKDPGFSPASIVEEAARTGRYADVELRSLDFDGGAPDPQALARRWHAVLAAARELIPLLPPSEAGRAVLSTASGPFRGDAAALRQALPSGTIAFHAGSIRGALPRLV